MVKDTATLSTEIVAAHISTTTLSPEKIPEFLEKIFDTIAKLRADPRNFSSPTLENYLNTRQHEDQHNAVQAAPIPARPAATLETSEASIPDSDVPQPTQMPDAPANGKPYGSDENPYDSIHDDGIDCLICGKRYTMLATHLTRTHHIDVDAYKAHWNLPAELLMTTASHSARQRATALDKGLGRKKGPDGTIQDKVGPTVAKKKPAQKSLPLGSATPKPSVSTNTTSTKPDHGAALTPATGKPYGSDENPYGMFSEDRITCLECGEEHIVLATHLRRGHGMTSTAYKRRWGLPSGMKLTPSFYSLHQRTQMERIGFGTAIRPNREGARADVQMPPKRKRLKLLTPVD